MKYQITLVRHVREYMLVTIDAKTEIEARKLARRYARENSDDFCDASYGGPIVKNVSKIVCHCKTPFVVKGNRCDYCGKEVEP